MDIVLCEELRKKNILRDTCKPLDPYQKHPLGTKHSNDGE